MRIFFAGDFCSKPSTSLISVSDELKNLIQSCDFNVVNFEVPLKPNITLPKQSRERFFQNDDAPEFLRRLGFNLFQLANNHAFDWGTEGFHKTKDALGDDSFGAGIYEEAYKVKVVEKDGVKIGFLSLSFAAYTGVFDDVANHDGEGCAYINDLKVNHVILEAKKEVDFLFVLPHDGIEYIDVPLPETIARYRDFVDYGADGVFGTHPHCPQGWEEYKGRPIFYSLGNFFFNSKEDTLYRAWNRFHWYEGRCVVLSIEEKKISWEVVNTKNVDNVALEIDCSEKSKLHNELICGYLQDNEAYNAYMMPVQEEQFRKDMRLIQKTFNPKTVREAVSVLKECFKMRLHGQKPMSGEKMMYMLKNDLKRNIIVRVGVKN